MKPERQPRNRTAAPQEEENRIAGRNPVMEALKSGTPLDTIYMSGKQGILGQIAQLAADQGIPVKIVSDARLSQMTRQTHQGVVADGACATYASIAEILEYAAEKGEKPLTAALKGAGEIGFTIISLTYLLFWSSARILRIRTIWVQFCEPQRRQAFMVSSFRNGEVHR